MNLYFFLITSISIPSHKPIVMNIMSQNLLLLVLSCICFISPFTHASTHNQRKSYIVYMGELSKSKSLASVREEHHNLLSSVIGDEILARESIIHSYGKSFNAVAAKLLPHEAKKLMDSGKVVSVFESTIRKLHTTRSWSFLGMPDSSNHNNVHNSSANKRLASESNMIIGMLDTGIYMAAPSFSDRGFGPIPRKWKGSCQRAVNFTGCNKKVIGAKSFRLDPQDPDDTPDTPLDMDGHGSHTASIAAGVRVRGASLYGVGKGNARGGVPNARIAAYKVCWGVGCSDVDLLAGFDQAIFDGVDVLSVSIGGPSREFFLDVVSIGAFHAMKKGILTVCSAGNSGPYEGSVENVSPWLLTVGASSIDRKFVTGFKLGNGKSAYGMSINTFSPRKQAYLIVNGAQASKLSGSHVGNASACEYNTLGADKVKGRIVYCLGASGQDYTVKTLGGAGTIMSTEEDKKMIAKMTQIPATIVKLKDGKYIDNYINSTLNPTAIIFKTKAVRMTAPFMASFSSRGPQKISPNILKPDIAAPGLNILAAYTKLISITGYTNDRRFSAFNIMSGTSMACPHVTAAAAYVKSFHPDWSASAIKSALMTTATPMRVKEKGGELGTGAGQLNPTAALHPGLIYDLRMSSYIRFLCKEGYNSTTIGRLLGGKAKHDCSSYKHALGVDGLNYPSMHVNVGKSKSPINTVFYRTVTYEGTGKAKFKATVNSLKGLTILVAPNTLEFDHRHQRRSFKVIVKGNAFRKGDSPVVSAALVWKNLDDPKIVVRSPIVVYRQISRH